MSRPGIRRLLPWLLLGAADRQPFTDRSEVHLDFPDAPAPEPPPEDGLSDLPQVRPAAPIVGEAALCVNRFYPKTQLSWLARLDHSHCNSADPLTDRLEVCCVFYRPGPGGAMCVVWWWKVLESRGRGGLLLFFWPALSQCEWLA